MRLTDLLGTLVHASDIAGLQAAPGGGIAGPPADGIEITGLTCDSRQVQPGFLFAALPGSRANGAAFVGDAVRRGAAVVLGPPGTPQPIRDQGGGPVPLLLDDNPRRRFSLLAARFFGRQPETVAAVTGTNGKTSVVSFLRQIWTTLGHLAASLGTLGIDAPGLAQPGSLTTPDPVTLHATLARLAEEGIERLAMEASSHGLDQHRLDGVRIAAAAFTNLTRDHLDYHGSMQAYRSAKLRLFSELLADDGAAVICADDPQAGAFRSAATARGVRLLDYGRTAAAFSLRELRPMAEGQQMTVVAGGVTYDLLLPLAGDFQALNALAAAALAVATGAATEDALAALATLQPVRGRLQQVARLDNGAAAYVDYAHTPDALAVALRALRPQAAGRLSVLFGCGGDRDPGKRPQMGLVAAELADRVIVTDDNPRSEDPGAIRRAVLAGCPRAREIGDRAQAIFAAVRELAPGDVLLVAGKGHETGQVVGSTVLPFDDADVVRAAARERGA